MIILKTSLNRLYSDCLLLLEDKISFKFMHLFTIFLILFEVKCNADFIMLSVLVLFVILFSFRRPEKKTIRLEHLDIKFQDQKIPFWIKNCFKQHL